MTHEQVVEFIETVEKIKNSGGPLSQYFPREIADALNYLIQSAVAKERERCAILAESAAEPAGLARRGEELSVDPTTKATSLDIAARIRRR